MLKKQILIVDNDKLLRENMKIELQNNGYTVHACATGDEAINIIEDEFIDIVFLDVHLPGSNIKKEKLVRLIKESNKNTQTPIILITGKNMMEASLTMMKFGCSDFILKTKTFFEDIISVIKSNTGSSTEKVYLKINQLANILYNRKKAYSSPYHLILGAGASVSSGCEPIRQIIDAFTEKYTRNGFYPPNVSKDIIVDTELEKMNLEQQMDILRPYLQYKHISSGYKHLADLIKMKYFKRIITTNIDSILKNLFQSHSIQQDELIVDYHDDNKIKDNFFREDEKIKILKLHGDLDANVIRFTKKAIFQFNDTIQKILKRVLNENIIIIGQQMRDFDIMRNIDMEGGPVWYVNPNKPTDKIFTAMDHRKSLDNIVDGVYGIFDNFFDTLYDEINKLEK